MRCYIITWLFVIWTTCIERSKGEYTKCDTEDGVKGHCINSIECSSAKSATITRSRCDDPNKVCCPFSQPIQTQPTTTVCPVTALPPDPNSECCENYGDFNKIIGGAAAEIDQFTWLALIEYDENIGCGGALISASYVLTAAHCVIIYHSGLTKNVTGVRLGEYNIVKSGADCVLTAGGGTDCTDGAVSIPAQRTIVHELYRAPGQNKWHDIALIQLARMVQFTSFITPICLPTTNISANPPADGLFVAGWGSITADDVSPSFIKLYVELPFVNFNKCAGDYLGLNKSSKILWHGQICAGGVPGRDTCKGDSGGPLMHFKDGRVHIVGVVSFGSLPCGSPLPGVYTNVVEYLDWIRNHTRQ